jgi:hypothetical protein
MAELLGDIDCRRCLVVRDDQDLGVEIAQIELEFVRAIRGIERRPQWRGGDAQESHRHLGPIVEHDSRRDRLGPTPLAFSVATVRAARVAQRAVSERLASRAC